MVDVCFGPDELLAALLGLLPVVVAAILLAKALQVLVELVASLIKLSYSIGHFLLF